MTPEFCLLNIQHWSTCMTKAEWSGWMQAIFSVLAIVAGSCFIWFQTKHQEKMQLEAQLQEEIDCAALLWVAGVTIRAFTTDFKQKVHPRPAPGVMVPRPNFSVLKGARNRMSDAANRARRPYPVVVQAYMVIASADLFAASFSDMLAAGDVQRHWVSNYPLANHHAEQFTANLDNLWTEIELLERRVGIKVFQARIDEASGSGVSV